MTTVRYILKGAVVVELERGMEPSPEEVRKAIRNHLTREQIHVHVVKGREFGGSRVVVKNAAFDCRVVRGSRNRAAVESFLANTGALSIDLLVEHGFRKGDITRWLNTGALYRPYGAKEPNVVMVKR